MVSRFAIYAVILAVFSSFYSIASAQSDAPKVEFAPVLFDLETGPLQFVADERLDVVNIGTLEMAVTLPDFGGLAFPQVITLVSHEGVSGNGYRLQIGAGGTQLGFFNGSAAETIRYDFRRGGYFHIALSVRGDRTRVFINGDQIGDLGIGFGSGRSMPIIIGGIPSGLDSFLGEFHYFRLWDLDLTRAELIKTEDYFGQPTGFGGLDNHLVAFTEFTNVGQSLNYVRPLKLSDQLSTGRSGGQRGGAEFVLKVPKSATITHVDVSYSTKLHSLTLRYTDAAGTSFSETIAGSAKPGDDLPPCSPEPCARAVAQNFASQAFDPSVSIVGVTLGIDNDLDVASVMLHFSDGTDGVQMGVNVPEENRSRHDIPEGSTFAGFGGGVDEYIQFAGPLYHVPLPFTDISGRWNLAFSGTPTKVPDADVIAQGSTVPHGNYTDQTAFILDTSDDGEIIRVTSRFGTETFHLTNAAGVYTDLTTRRNLTFEDNDTADLYGNQLEKVDPYPVISARDGSFNEFGGTFNLDNQVPFTQHMFHGYDLGHIDPENLQDPAALRGQVFKAPAADSLDFYPSYQKIVPFGLLHFPDARERSERISRTMASAHDYTSSKSSSVGVNIGVPKVASFGYNRSVREKMGRQSQSKTMFAETKDLRTQRALVVDERHIELSELFRDRIYDLARLIKLGKPANPARIYASFGTHYSHAMTIGTVSVNTVRISSTGYKDMYEKGVKVGVKASATIKKVDAGGSLEVENGSSDAFNKSLEKEAESINGVGSDLEPVPVFLDLRPLSDLLAPPHFTDPVITGVLRNELKTAITTYLSNSPGNTIAPEDIWEPYFFELDFLDAQDVELKTTDPNGVPIIGNSVNRFYGAFQTIGPMEQGLRTQARILEGNAHDAVNGGVFSIPGEPIQIMATASELCGLPLPGGGRGPAAVVSIGANLITDWGTDNDPDDVVVLGFQGNTLLLSALPTNLVTGIMEITNNELTPDAIKVRYTYRRLPDLDGGYKEIPQCN
jgi:hypothetical protein